MKKFIGLVLGISVLISPAQARWDHDHHSRHDHRYERHHDRWDRDDNGGAIAGGIIGALVLGALINRNNQNYDDTDYGDYTHYCTTEQRVDRWGNVHIERYCQ